MYRDGARPQLNGSSACCGDTSQGVTKSGSHISQLHICVRWLCLMLRQALAEHGRRDVEVKRHRRRDAVQVEDRGIGGRLSKFVLQYVPYVMQGPRSCLSYHYLEQQAVPAIAPCGSC